MGSPTAAAGYPSKLEAAIALAAKGLTRNDIAAQIGSSEGSVYEMLRKHRKQAAGEQPKPAKPKTSKPAATPQPGIWTPEKIDKARRLFGKTMVLIAEALQVPADELLHYALDGEIPPMGKAQRIGMLLTRNEVRRQEAEARREAVPQLPAPPQESAPDREESNAEAKAVDEANSGQAMSEPAAVAAGPDAAASSPAGGRSPAATSERMDATSPGGENPAPKFTLPAFEPPMAATVKQRFRLRNEAGEYLHEHERGMTRIGKFYWRGTADEVARLKRRKPQFRQLDEEECLS